MSEVSDRAVGLVDRDDLADKLPEKQDWILSNIANMVNAFDYEFGITLTVGGVLLSGTLIGAKRYHQEMVRYLSGNDVDVKNKSEKANILSEYFDYTLTLYPPIDPDKAFAEEVNYLHLKDAKVFLGGGTVVPSRGGVLWRGRIATVEGFFLGLMKAE